MDSTPFSEDSRFVGDVITREIARIGIPMPAPQTVTIVPSGRRAAARDSITLGIEYRTDDQEFRGRCLGQMAIGLVQACIFHGARGFVGLPVNVTMGCVRYDHTCSVTCNATPGETVGISVLPVLDALELACARRGVRVHPVLGPTENIVDGMPPPLDIPYTSDPPDESETLEFAADTICHWYLGIEPVLRAQDRFVLLWVTWTGTSIRALASREPPTPRWAPASMQMHPSPIADMCVGFVAQHGDSLRAAFLRD
jgi:hypothetical protein